MPRGKENVVALGGLRQSKERTTEVFFKNQQGSELKCNVDNTVEDAKKQMTAQTSTSWYKSILKM